MCVVIVSPKALFSWPGLAWQQQSWSGRVDRTAVDTHVDAGAFQQLHFIWAICRIADTGMRWILLQDQCWFCCAARLHASSKHGCSIIGSTKTAAMARDEARAYRTPGCCVFCTQCKTSTGSASGCAMHSARGCLGRSRSSCMCDACVRWGAVKQVAAPAGRCSTTPSLRKQACWEPRGLGCGHCAKLVCMLLCAYAVADSLG
jgi:hypothetical protein